METTKKESLLSQILDKGMEAIRRPFVINRATRAFASAADSIEEQLMNKQVELNNARERFVDACKTDERNLSEHIQSIINIRREIAEFEEAKVFLEEEKTEFL